MNDGAISPLHDAGEDAVPPEKEHVLFSVLDGGVDLLIGVALIGELVVVLANSLARAFFHFSLLWTDEAAGIALTILAFVGGAIAYKRDQHSFVQTIVNALPLPYRRGCHAITDWTVIVIAIVTGYFSLPLITNRMGQLTTVLEIPVGLTALPFTVGMALLIVYAARRLRRAGTRIALWTGAGVIALTLLLVATRPVWAPVVAGATAMTCSLVALLVLVMLGLPVGFALLFSAIAYLYATGISPMISVPLNMTDGITAFILLALPFFILAGAIMEKGGISRRLVGFVRSLVGHVRGGLLQATVVSIYLVSGLSGSKAADVAAVGYVMRDMLKRERYKTEEAAAVLAASAAMGETIPPSLGLLVLGSVTSLSMGALFTAGIIPAAVIAVCLMALIAARARLFGMPRSDRATGKERVQSGLAAILPLLMPVIMLGGIRGGIATPTEVSSFAVAYGLGIAIFVYRAFDLRSFGRMISDAAAFSGMLLFILAAASAFSHTLSAARLPQQLVFLVQSLHGDRVLFLLLSSVLLIVCGSALEGLPAIIILAPILLPLAGTVGVDQLHYAIVLLVAMGIGAFLPPLGVGFYIACAVAGTKIGPASRVMIPYAGVLVVGLIIIAFVPSLTLALPALFKGR